MNQVISLDGKWEFRQAGRKRRVSDWLAAEVPGTVHTDLLANRRIEDPFFRANEQFVGWVDDADWVYRRRFEVPAEFLQETSHVWLEFDGLDTFAVIRLNGRRIGATDNMFHPWRFAVRRRLKEGANRLEVEFTSAKRVSEALARRSKIEYHAAFFRPRPHIRKAQYAGGWDWGPRFLTCGVWRPVRLRAVRQARISDVCALVRDLTGRRAKVTVTVEVESHATAAAELRLDLQSPKGEAAAKATVGVRLRPGQRTVRAELAVDRPERWWPHGLGEQALYGLTTSLAIAGKEVDAREDRIGLRTVELVREKDAQGESFRFRINGRDVFCKGANWIPADSFLPRVTPERYRGLLTDARDAHMNMVRVWGGGIYEEPAFYRACDELGLMVWQDFPFACAEYPEHRSFLQSVRREAEHAVRRLRNHPCVVIWNGNNENQWLNGILWPQTKPVRGATIYDRVLPAVCRKLDPTRPYWPGSPTGGPEPNSPHFGNQHVWAVWGNWAKPETYRDWPARFVTEFGFQGMPPDRTVKEFTAPEDRHLFSRVLDLHNRMNEGHPRIMKYLAHALGVPRDLDEYIYLSQVLQADVIKLGVEHWRRRWPASAGAIYWQLNDCWPVASWSAIDYHGRPKALWYASRRFFAPLLVSFRPLGNEQVGPVDVELWATNDGRSPIVAELEVISRTLRGRRLMREVIPVRVPGNGSRRLTVLTPGFFNMTEGQGEYIHACLRQGKGILAENVHFPSAGKYMAWPNPGIHCRVRSGRDRILIHLEAAAFARAVCLTARRGEGRFSDNFFDLHPGRPYQVHWVPAGPRPSPESFGRGLVVRSMADWRGRPAVTAR